MCKHIHFLIQGTSFLGQQLVLMGHNCSSNSDMPPQTVILPDTHLYEVHQMMTLLHEVSMSTIGPVLGGCGTNKNIAILFIFTSIKFSQVFFKIKYIG